LTDLQVRDPAPDTATESSPPSEADLPRELESTDAATPDTDPLAALAPVVTIEELSAYLRLNHKTVRDAIARGDIPGVRRIGGAIRIHRDTVLGWLSSGKGSASSSSRRFR
jgi:excisionase family DNA binding protein